MVALPLSRSTLTAITSPICLRAWLTDIMQWLQDMPLMLTVVVIMMLLYDARTGRTGLRAGHQYVAGRDAGPTNPVKTAVREYSFSIGIYAREGGSGSVMHFRVPICASRRLVHRLSRNSVESIPSHLGRGR